MPIPPPQMPQPVFDPHAGKPCTGLENGCPVCLKLSESRRGDELDALDALPFAVPTPADLERWSIAARDVPGPIGRAILTLITEVKRLREQREKTSAHNFKRLGVELSTIVLSAAALGEQANPHAFKLAEGLACASAELERLQDQRDRFDALLRRVRCYSVVDTMGDPGASSSSRMLGIERDIDDALEGRPARPNPFKLPADVAARARAAARKLDE